MKGGRVVKLTPSPSKNYSQKASFIRVKTYLGKEKVFNFISSMIEESKHFNKGLVMTKEGKEDLRTLLNVGSVTMIVLIMMLK